jgi:hypothetical protein
VLIFIFSFKWSVNSSTLTKRVKESEV